MVVYKEYISNSLKSEVYRNSLGLTHLRIKI